MCSEFLYLDNVDFSNQLSQRFAIQSSEDGRISIATDVGVQVLQLSLRSDSTIPSISFKKIFIPPFKYVFGANLGVDPNSFGLHLERKDLYNLALQVDIAPQFHLYVEDEAKILACKWSPSHMDKTNCVLAVLNSTGLLNVYARSFTNILCDNYVPVCNISEHIINLYKSTWVCTSKMAGREEMQELERRIQAKPTVFTWSKIVVHDNKNYCFLIVGHLNGDVTFFKFSIDGTKSSKEACVTCVYKISTSLRNITAIHIHQTKSRALLFIGDIKGNAVVIPILYLTITDIKFGETNPLWVENDNVQVDSFDILIHNKCMYILCCKGTVLLIYLVNKKGDIIDKSVFHVGNLDITGLEKVDDNIILVLTVAGAMKELKLTCPNNKIEVEWRHMYINVNWATKKAHGFMFSQNKVLLGVLTYPGRVKDKKSEKNFINLILFTHSTKDPLILLLNNHTNSLHNYWDCLEVIRVSSMLRKRLPCNDLAVSENYDDFNFIKLKTYLHLARISEVIYEQLEIMEDEYRIKSAESIQYIINLKLIVYRMQFILDLHAEEKTTKFQLQNLFVLNNYLKQITLDGVIPKFQIGFNIVDEMLDVVSRANKLHYPEVPRCFICYDQLLDSKCHPHHFDSRCAISMMQLDVYSTYKCPFCKCRVHRELGKEMDTLFCPYCDIALDLQVLLKNADHKLVSHLSCKQDCDAGTLCLEDIEEEAIKLNKQDLIG